MPAASRRASLRGDRESPGRALAGYCAFFVQGEADEALHLPACALVVPFSLPLLAAPPAADAPGPSEGHRLVNDLRTFADP